jgi:hypothetical protein
MRRKDWEYWATVAVCLAVLIVGGWLICRGMGKAREMQIQNMQEAIRREARRHAPR